MPLSEIQQAISNVKDGVTRDALTLIAAHLAGFNTHTHVCAATDAISSYPSTLAPTKVVPTGSESSFPV
jgi:hypothetical protein